MNDDMSTGLTGPGADEGADDKGDRAAREVADSMPEAYRGGGADDEGETDERQQSELDAAQESLEDGTS